MNNRRTTWWPKNLRQIRFNGLLIDGLSSLKTKSTSLTPATGAVKSETQQTWFDQNFCDCVVLDLINDAGLQIVFSVWMRPLSLITLQSQSIIR